MSPPWDPREHLALLRYSAKWTLLTLPVALATGSAVALFLVALEWATQTRWRNPWLLFLLSLAGAAIAIIYHRLGKHAESGTNLIMDHIHQPGAGASATAPGSRSRAPGTGAAGLPR